MGGWLELDFLPCVFVQTGCSSCADKGGVETRGGVVDDMIMAEGGADIPLYEWAEALSFIRGESWLLDDAMEPGRRSSVIA
jgi:hypothetical protein